MKYRLLTVQFTFNNCIFKRMIVAEGLLTLDNLELSTAIETGIRREHLSNVIILYSLEITKEEALTFKSNNHV